jgi:hypothetical protein
MNSLFPNFCLLRLILFTACFVLSISAQPVRVTLVLDTNKVAVGQSTILHAYAEIAPDVKPATLQIFSWYVDFLNENPSFASATYAALQRPASDKDPRISSSGTTEGANRRGIYDTFLNLPDAGHDGPVELFSIPVTGLAAGDASFKVSPGTTVPGLSSDFIVAPEGGGDPLVGADYSDASTTLQVAQSQVTSVPIHISATPLGGGQTRVSLTFQVQQNANQYVESVDVLGASQNWRTLPGGPHNTGTVTETNSLPMRFYRLRITQ